MIDFKPYRYQQYCIDLICRKPNVGLFIDMGLGKTAITLSAIKRLKYDMLAVRRVLVIAPKSVAASTWTAEAAKWVQTSDLRIAVVLGSAKQREKILQQKADVFVINRENTQWIVNFFGSKWPFDMVVLDESSSFKNPKAVRFKAIKKVRSKINRLVELSGTPCAQGLEGLWSQLYLLDDGARLGRTLTSYRDAYFVPDKRNHMQIFSYKPAPGAEDAIQARISDICISMSSEDYLDLPELCYDDIPVQLDASAKKAYKQLEHDQVLALPEDAVVTAGTAAVLRNKLLQACNGSVYDSNGLPVCLHPCKLNALREAVERLNGQHSIICYRFKHDLPGIVETLQDTGLRVSVYSGDKDAVAWNNGDIDLLIIQPQQCGYGLNLQEGGHHLLWFGLPDSLELYQQTNKRLHRNGQKHPVVIHHLIVQSGVDEDVVFALSGKADVQERLLEAIKARIDRIRSESKKL